MMQSRIIQTIRNKSEIIPTHLLVNYAYSVVEWSDGATYPKSGLFDTFPTKLYNTNQVELKVYGMIGRRRDLINTFILPAKFTMGEYTKSGDKYAIAGIYQPHEVQTLLLELAFTSHYPSIYITMSNVDEDYCDAYFVEVPKLVMYATQDLLKFDPNIYRMEGDNLLYAKDLSIGGGEDEYMAEPEEPSWDDE